MEIKIFNNKEDELIFCNHFGNRTFYYKSINTTLFKKLKESFHLDTLIKSANGEWGRLRLSPSNDEDKNNLISASIPTIEFIKTKFSEGHSIIYNDLQDINKYVFAICKYFSFLLLSGSNCNCYITPGYQQALKKHYDDQDVIVIQISGKKKWKVYRPDINLNPIINLEYSQEYVESSKNFDEYILEPMSILYIPRGFCHEAISLDETSLHFTISVQNFDKIDLMKSILEDLSLENRDSFSLRSNIPPLMSENISNDIKSTFKSIYNNNIDEYLNNFIIKRIAMVNSLFTSNRPKDNNIINSNSKLTKNLENIYFLKKETSQVFIEDGILEIENDALFELIEKLYNDNEIHISDIPDSFDKLDIANDLIKLRIATIKN